MTDDRPGRPPVTPPEDPWPQSPYSPPERPTPTDRRRAVPWWLVAVAAATAVLAVVTFVVVLTWPGGADPARPLEFRAFEPVTRVDFGEDADPMFTGLLDGRGYAAAQVGDDLELVAVDLTDGEERWRQRIGGTGRWGYVYPTPEAVLVVADEIGDQQRRPLIVRDAETGDEAWRRAIRGDDQVFARGGTVAVTDREWGRLLGLELATGRQLWSAPFPDGGPAAVVPVLTEEDLAGPSALSGAPAGPPVGERVVLVGADRSAQVIDVRTGEPVATGPNVAAPDDLLLAYGDRLFVAPDEGGYQVLSYGLDELSAVPRIVYTAPDDQRRPAVLRPCFTDWLCLLDRAGTDRDTTEALAVDVAQDGTGDPPRWRRPASGADRLLPVGSWLVVGGGEPAVVAYNPDGEEVLGRSGAAVRLNAGNLLVFATAPEPYLTDLNVAGYAVDSPQRTELGPVPQVLGQRCSWRDVFLVCPTRTGAEVWSFAGD